MQSQNQTQVLLSPHQTGTELRGNGPTPDALRIALVGKTGCGKSSTGNTILGRKAFYAQAEGKSVTQTCKKVDTDVDGRRVAVVDTPGLFDTSVSNEDICRELSKSVSLLAPGPHAFLLLIQIGRSTAEEKGAVEYIKKIFGDRAQNYIMVLFTRGDDLEEDEMSIEDYIQTTDGSLQELISDCGNRFHVFNNRKTIRTQVKELLQKIDHMVKENGGSCYTNDMLREAEEANLEEHKRIQREKEEEIKAKREKMERKYQQEMENLIKMEKLKQEDEKRQMEEKLRQKEKQLKEVKELRIRARR